MQPLIGAQPLEENRHRFRVWAPAAASEEVALVAPTARTVPLNSAADGYFSAVVENVPSGSLYYYRLGGDTR